MKTSLGLALASLVTFRAGSASAHPGHGGADGNGALHYLVDHPLLALGFAAVIVGGTVLASRILARRD